MQVTFLSTSLRLLSKCEHHVSTNPKTIEQCLWFEMLKPNPKHVADPDPLNRSLQPAGGGGPKTDRYPSQPKPQGQK